MGHEEYAIPGDNYVPAALQVVNVLMWEAPASCLKRATWQNQVTLRVIVRVTVLT